MSDVTEKMAEALGKAHRYLDANLRTGDVYGAEALSSVHNALAAYQDAPADRPRGGLITLVKSSDKLTPDEKAALIRLWQGDVAKAFADGEAEALMLKGVLRAIADPGCGCCDGEGAVAVGPVNTIKEVALAPCPDCVKPDSPTPPPAGVVEALRACQAWIADGGHVDDDDVRSGATGARAVYEQATAVLASLPDGEGETTLADLERREREQDQKSNRVAEMERTLRAWLEMQSQENRSALYNAGLAYFGIKSLIPDDDYDPDEGEVYP